MRDHKLAPTDRLTAMATDVGCFRFLAEEVAAATAEASRPVVFLVAAPAGERLRAEFVKLVASPAADV